MSDERILRAARRLEQGLERIQAGLRRHGRHPALAEDQRQALDQLPLEDVLVDDDLARQRSPRWPGSSAHRPAAT